MSHHWRPHREAPESGGRGKEENCEQEPLPWFPREGTGKAEKACLGLPTLSTLNNSNRIIPLDMRPVLSCLISGPAVSRACV